MNAGGAVPAVVPAVLPVAPGVVEAGGGGGNQGLNNGGAAGAADGEAGVPCPSGCAVEGRPGAGNELPAPPAPPRIMFDIWSIIRSDSGLDLYVAISSS